MITLIKSLGLPGSNSVVVVLAYLTPELANPDTGCEEIGVILRDNTCLCYLFIGDLST